MMRPPPASPPHAEPTAGLARLRRRPAGFSFVEVLFAVMILGIGFIMLAAVFPVAIQQTQTAGDESVSAAVAWNALTVIQAKLSDSEMPPVGPDAPFVKAAYPGVVRSLRDPQAPGVASLRRGQLVSKDWQQAPTFAQPTDYLWNRVRGESVVVDDRRFAWVAFYRRQYAPGTAGDPVPYAQVLVVVARARETPAYGRRDIDAPAAANLQPRRVTFDLTSDGAGPVVDQRVKFTGGEIGAVAEGTYLVVAHDKLTGITQGSMNCNVFRIGNHVRGNLWELSPQADFAPLSIKGAAVKGLTGAEGYVVGRTADGGGYQGVAQDVAVYSMIIPAQ